MKDRVKEVLRDLIIGFSIDEVWKNRGYSRKQSVQKIVDRYVKKGILVNLGKGFVLSDDGLKLFSEESFIKEGKRMVEVHKIAYVVPIMSYLKFWKDFLFEAERLLGMSNFDAKYSLPDTEIIVQDFFYVTLRITRDSFRIQPKPFVSGSVDNCLDSCDKFVNDLIPKIEKFFYCHLNKEDIWTELSLNERHIAFVKHPFAVAVEKKGFRLRVFNDDGELMYYSDGSPDEFGNPKYHLETAHKTRNSVYAKRMESACKDIGDGFSIRKNAKQVEEVGSRLDTLQDNVSLMAKQSSELFSNFSAYNENIRLHLKVLEKIDKSQEISNKNQEILNRNQETLNKTINELREEIKKLKKSS